MSALASTDAFGCGARSDAPARQYSSAQDLRSSTTDGRCSVATGGAVARIPQPPAVSATKEFLQSANTPRQTSRNSAPDSNFARRSETEVEVRELRNQVKMLSHELRQLRTEFTGSMQHLHTIDEGATMAPVLQENQFSSASMIMRLETANDLGGWKAETDSVKPPLPPRLYRPAKPQRTFAHGSTSILNLPSENVGPFSPALLPSTNCSSVSSSFRSEARGPTTSFHGSHSSFFKPPPPPPPRLGVSRSFGAHFPINNADHPPLPPPHPPPKPSTAAADKTRSEASANTAVGDNRPRAPAYGQQRRISQHPSAQGRPAHIHTNGSIGGSNLSPPHYQQKSNVFAYHQAQLVCSHSVPASLGIGKSADKGLSVTKPPPYQQVDEPRKKLNLDVAERLTQFGGDPLSDENLVQNLESGFRKGVCWYELGPVLLFLNSYNDVASPPTLANLKDAPRPLKKLASDIRARFFECETSQAIVFDGDRGSGKTYLSSQLIKELLRLFCDNGTNVRTLIENGVNKQFAATLTLLRSLTSVRRDEQNYSSQAAFTYDLHMADGVLYKAKAYCSYLDYHRLVQLPPGESNFRVLYQLMAGLSVEEKRKFHLLDYTIDDLNYLRPECADDIRQQQHHHQQEQTRVDKALFAQFRSALTTLGIPFSDIMRIFAAVLLLGNVRFSESKSGNGELVADGNKELDSAAALLGVTTLTLFKAFTKNQRRQKGESIQTSRSAQSANDSLSALAITLYHRCASAILRRANSVKPFTRVGDAGTAACGLPGAVSCCNNLSRAKPRPASGISSSDESSVHDSGIGVTSQSSPNANSSANGVTSSSSRNSCQGLDGAISVLDWFGFSHGQRNQFEQLCSNYAAEKLQQFYRVQLFERNNELAQREGVRSDFDWKLFNGENCESSSLLDTLRLLDEQSARNKPDVTESLKERFEENGRPEIRESSNTLAFIVRHYTSTEVTYEGTDRYSKINKDQLNADLVRIFSSQTCNFGFLSYLFAPDSRKLENQPETVAVSRITPIPGMDSRHDQSTFGEDFSLQMDAVLRSISGSKVRFVHCIKSNAKMEYFYFDADEVTKQCKRLDVLPTVHMLNAGLPCAVRLKGFNDRYRFLALRYHSSAVLKQAPTMAEETRAIIDCYLRAVDESNLPYISNHWAVGSEHVFLSEGARVQLELLRDQRRVNAASVIQRQARLWLRRRRGRCFRGTVPANSKGIELSQSHNVHFPSPPAGNPKPRKSGCGAAPMISQCSSKTKEPPPLPPSRSYSVYLDKRVNFPQRRIFVQNYKDASTCAHFSQNEIVTALGWGPTKNQLLIRNCSSADGKNGPTVVVVPTNYTKLCMGS